MAKEIIVLGANVGNIFTAINCVFWYSITTGVATRANGSVWAGASTAENNAILAGTVLEETQTFQFPTNLATADTKAWLVQYWTNRNAQIGGIGPGLYANVYDDSVTGWSA
jgi:hypothetical protein